MILIYLILICKLIVISGINNQIHSFQINHILYIICKHCSSENLTKQGFTKLKKQKFLCKSSKKCQIEGSDERKKYDQKIIQTALILFSDGNNYRRIARILSKIFNKKTSY